MPKTIYINDLADRYKVATEAELLEFANAVRTAGGANTLSALLPSFIGDSHACLIANALNFKCEITHFGYGSVTVKQAREVATGIAETEVFASGAPKWQMLFPENMDEERIHAIAKAIPGCRARRLKPSGRLVMTLPEHIGNAAAAFDSGDAFENFARDE